MAKTIKIDVNKCTGCRACEAICSAYHAEASGGPFVNPRRSRVRVFNDEQSSLYVPIFAGPYTDVECNGRNTISIDGKEYGQCSFCRASCPSRELFKEPDTQIPLKCDMCGEPAPLKPMCVSWCISEALIYNEETVEGE